ncbi:MAG TPA: Rne/Rng family ribonuclease [Rhizomicrobium sp.]|jgi:ribonuclease G|nr:Rne/Rng family ribonuclease [Rhizomicrobium sp.]
MKKEILINAGVGELRVAIMEDGRLQELLFECSIGTDDGTTRRRGSGQSLIGNIILGRVQRVLPGMQAAFVDIGLDRAGFLGAREARCLADLHELELLPASAEAHSHTSASEGFGGEERTRRIGDCVHEGEDIVVQVVKDPIGEKGARLSASISLPGRLLVLIPNQKGIALSRRIEDEAERERLKGLCQEMVAEGNGRLATGAGYIVRSAAVGAELPELRDDAERMAEAWAMVTGRRRKTMRAPAVLHQELEPIERVMRDEVDAETRRVIIDDPQALAAARAYCRRTMPGTADRLELFEGPGLIFGLYDIEDEIERLAATRVPLASGGWITIECTEALTAIDVNSGSYTEAGGLEETSLCVNLEAAEEIGRQLRLRGIGGLIVIDFIHVSEKPNAQKLMSALEESLAGDRTPTQLLPMSEFGLVEVTRKRVRDPLMRMMTEACRPCRGRGRIRSSESVVFEILRRIEREAQHAPGRPMTVRASPEVVHWYQSHEPELREAIARRKLPRFTFEARPEFAREGFDVASN